MNLFPPKAAPKPTTVEEALAPVSEIANNLRDLAEDASNRIGEINMDIQALEDEREVCARRQSDADTTLAKFEELLATN